MKKTIILLLFCILSTNVLTAQQTISETEKLVSLGKIYGFLKYYHPEVAKGKFDWDKAFIKQLPVVLNAKDKASLSEIYNNWIESLGEIKKCKKCDFKENYFNKNFSLSWTQDTTIFDDKLISKLKYIENNRNQTENYYVTTEKAGNIKITNEPIYEGFDYPKEEYRLLGLFKYWNTIEYFYPYKYLTDQDWDAVLREMIPKIRNASNKEAYQFAVKEVTAKLDDSHAWISFGNTSVSKSLPVKIANIENQAVIAAYYNDSIAALNNLKLGDVILKINGADITSKLERQLKITSGSNQNFKTNRAYDYIFTGVDDTLKLTVKRDGEILDLNSKRYDFKAFNYIETKRKVKSKSINENIGYINMASRFTFKEFDKIFELFKSKKSIIIDLRAYPQFSYQMFTRYFNTENRIFAKIYSPDISYPGKFVFKVDLETGSSKSAFKGEFILLVSDDSLSLSEFMAMAFQTADNIITVGNQTAGADGDIVAFKYLGGYRTAFSGNRVLYPDGYESQRNGVKIDVEIKPTIKGLREGRDEVLEKAIILASE